MRRWSVHRFVVRRIHRRCYLGHRDATDLRYEEHRKWDVNSSDGDRPDPKAVRRHSVKVGERPAAAEWVAPWRSWADRAAAVLVAPWHSWADALTANRLRHFPLRRCGAWDAW